jgi:hypothetical protein
MPFRLQYSISKASWTTYTDGTEDLLNEAGYPCFSLRTQCEFAMERFRLRHGCSYFLRIEEISDQDYWHERERGRFGNAYVHVPWAGEPWNVGHEHHYPHLSQKQLGKIAFTEDDKKGMADRQTIISPGRYLTRFFSDKLTPKEIERWAGAVSMASKEFELKITQDADEIEAIYVNGPGSCMSGKRSWEVHPARIYAGPDLAVAYLGTPEKPTARCVIWPEKKLRSVMYGDVTKLEIALDGADYVEGEMYGARLRKIELGHGAYVMPYLDCAPGIEDGDEFFITGGDDNDCSTQDGKIYLGSPCGNCCEIMRDGDEYFVQDIHETWCDECAESESWTDIFGQRFSMNAERTEVFYASWGMQNFDYHRTYEVNEVASFVPSRDQWWRDGSTFECHKCGENFVQGCDYDESPEFDTCKKCWIADTSIATLEAICGVIAQPALALDDAA